MFLDDDIKFFFIEELQPVNMEEIIKLCTNVMQPLIK